MKYLTTTAAALLLAGQATAGALIFEPAPEQEIVVVEPAPAGGSNAAWIIPVIALAAIAYAIAD